MVITTRGRYAVMAILDIASRNNSNPITLADVSIAQNIALSYLEQIFLRLKRCGIVTSVRGPGGGYLLAREPGKITIDQIIDAVEEDIDATRCGPETTKWCMPGNVKCRAHDLWDSLSLAIRDHFASVSIADVLSGSLKKAQVI